VKSFAGSSSTVTTPDGGGPGSMLIAIRIPHSLQSRRARDIRQSGGYGSTDH
jgi:hypothetical protein